MKSNGFRESAEAVFIYGLRFIRHTGEEAANFRGMALRSGRHLVNGNRDGNGGVMASQSPQITRPLEVVW